jgi:small-conductance mechanosensitive channel
MLQSIPFDNLITRLIADSHDFRIWWQSGVLLLCALAAWLVRRQARSWLDTSAYAQSAGHEGLKRIGFPLLMLLALLVGREVAKLALHSAPLLDIAVPLLLSLVLVRGVAFALHFAFEPRESLKAWERSITWLIWGAFALHLTGLLPRIHAAMEALSFQSGNHRFSLWLLGQAAAVIVVALILALTLARLVEGRLMNLTEMNLSLRMALAKAARTVLLILAVLVALPAVGIDLTVLSVLGGAIGVGIGFGLQKVASNYISGFIILLDRSVRIGDLVTVDNKYGQVSQINTRYTLLKALDGTETIVPNETLITQTVVNHSLSKPNVRIGIPVQVAYATDLERAKDLMLEAALSHDRVIQGEGEPEYLPKVFLREFADNGIQMELGVWIRDASEGQGNLRSDINWAIWRGFKEAGIEIPFPQRVVHLAGTNNPATNDH